MFLPAGRSHEGRGSPAKGWFTTTQWSVVLAAGGRDPVQSLEALESLCSAYWYPLYAYVRRSGRQPADAQDLTQEFFARLLEKDYLRAVDRRKGKFRSFLLAPASHHSPEQFFEQQWAITLLEQAVTKLRDEFKASGKEALFKEIKIFLTGEKRAVSHSELAERMNTTEAALKMSVSRMRQRYGELLRLEIANTVASPAEIDEELRALFAALSA